MASVQAIDLSAVSTAKLSVNTGRDANSSNQFNDLLHTQKTTGSMTSSQKDSTADTKTTMKKDDAIQAKYDSLKTDVRKDVINETKGDDNVVNEKTMDEVTEEIKDIIKENIDVDDEMIQNVLDSMGIVITDLLKPDVLQQFVLQLNGVSESTELLTNESLMTDFSNLLQGLSDYAEENADALAPLLEKLDVPVTLADVGLSKEMLQMTQSDKSFVGEEPIAATTTDTVQTVQTAQTAQTEVVSDVMTKDVTQENGTQSAVVKQSQGDVTNVKEEVPQSKANPEDAVIKSVTISEETANDSGMSSESDSEGNPLESGIQQLFVSESDTTAKNVTAEQSVFAQQLNVVQGNVSQVYDASLVGGQRMQQMVNIVNQVSEQMQQTVTENTTTLEMQLNPETLGKVLLSLTAKEGVMTATFHVQTEEARQALESQMYTLRENLEAKEIKVESVDVQISDFNFEQSTEAEAQRQENADKNSKKKFRYDVAEDEEEVSVEENAEQVRRQVMRDNGSSIDFTA